MHLFPIPMPTCLLPDIYLQQDQNYGTMAFVFPNWSIRLSTDVQTFSLKMPSHKG